MHTVRRQLKPQQQHVIIMIMGTCWYMMTVATADDDRGNTHHRQGSDFCFFQPTSHNERLHAGISKRRLPTPTTINDVPGHTCPWLHTHRKVWPGKVRYGGTSVYLRQTGTAAAPRANPIAKAPINPIYTTGGSRRNRKLPAPTAWLENAESHTEASCETTPHIDFARNTRSMTRSGKIVLSSRLDDTQSGRSCKTNNTLSNTW